MLLLGDDVTVYGVMCQRWKPCYDGAPCYVELVLRANNVEVANRSSHQSSCVAMKDIQQEFEDFWESYKHIPLAGRCVCVCTHIDIAACMSYILYIHWFCAITMKCLSLTCAGRSCILLSLCPQIFGMYIIKLAVALVLAGGVERRDSSGTKVRGRSLLPVFICGD